VLYGAIFLTTQITGLLLSITICFILRDFTIEFIKMAVVNSSLLGSALVASCHLTRRLMFAVNTGFIVLMTSLLVAGAAIISLFIVLALQPTLFVYYYRGAVSFVIINFLFIITLHVISSGFIISRETMIEKERAIASERLLKNRMELQMLTSRINPHFLFNTLNTIVSLLRQPDKAENAILDLSDLLRKSLEQSDKPLIPVSEELDTIKKYLELQKLRFGSRLEFTILCEAEFRLPPMVIQPLVENCIKHNMQNVEQLTIDLRITAAAQRCSVAVTDSAKALLPDMVGRGQGLAITRKRVEGCGGTFDIVNGGVLLSFPRG
jgi:LytS/YehU family sensor histidine kinase